MGFVVHELPRPEPCQDAVELVEELLARLKSGETVAVAIVDVRLGSAVATAWAGNEHYHKLNSGAARLSVRLASEQG